MLKEKLMPISIFCLSFSIIIGAVIISSGMKKNAELLNNGLSNGLYNIGSTIINANTNDITANKSTLNLSMAASYLGIPETKLTQFVDSPGSGIPFIKVGDQYIFSKTALDKWLETVRLKIE